MPTQFEQATLGNLSDQPPSSPNPGYSTGSQLVQQLQLVPPFTQTWKLLTVSFSAWLQIGDGSVLFPNGGSPYGRFGRIIAGMARGATGQSGIVTPLTQLPADQTMMAVLWDPANDALPPISPKSPNLGLPITCSITPPQPITIDQADPISFGIWMLPSLLGDSILGFPPGLSVVAAQYAYTYDDGLGAPAPL